MTTTKQQLKDQMAALLERQISLERGIDGVSRQVYEHGAALDEMEKLIDALSDEVPPPEPKPAESPVAIYYEFVYHNVVPQLLARRLNEMTGPGAYAILRYPWDRLETVKGQFQLEDRDEWRRRPEYSDYNRGLTRQIAVLKNAGFKILLKRHGVPRWATVGGVPSHETYECYKPGAPDLFDTSKPHCANPGDVIPEEVYEHGRFIGETYGPDVDLFCAGPNEPGLPVYNSLIKLVQLGIITLDGAIRRVMEHQIIPFTEGVRSVVPNARFLSTGADSNTILRLLLAYERDHDLHLFDELGIHAHSWASDGATSNSFERIKEFRVVLDELGNGRPEWLDEWEDRTKPVPPVGTHVEFLRGAFELLPRARVAGFHDLSHFFTPASWSDPMATGPRSEELYKPNETFRAVQEYVASAKVTA